MLDPILEVEMSPRIGPAVIIIDALDQCDDKKLMEEFIEVVTDACRENRPFPFRVILTSRVEEHLRKKLEAPAVCPLNLNEFDASDDIRKFFQSQFSTIYEENHEQMAMRKISLPWPSNADLERFIQEADGSFLRATTFINSIDVNNIPHRLLVNSRANIDSRRLSLSGFLRPFRRLSRSSLQQTSASEESSGVASPSSLQQTSASEESSGVASPLISSIPEITTIASEALDASRVIGSAHAEHSSRTHSSGASIPSDTPELAVSNKLPQLSRAEDGSIEATTSESLIEQLITNPPCGSIGVQFYPFLSDN
jgi:hypothetical protein